MCCEYENSTRGGGGVHPCSMDTLTTFVTFSLLPCTTYSSSKTGFTLNDKNLYYLEG